MGTTASVHINDDIAPAEFAEHLSAVRDELERLEQIFSVYRPTSEISRINRNEMHLLDASPEVIDVLDACTWLEQASGGAFCVRPHRDSSVIDPSGFVKGWAAERAARLLDDAGLDHWYLGVGGDYVVRGGFNIDTPWVIGIADPRRSDHLVGTVSIVDGGLATSGTAERGAHIWTAGAQHRADWFDSVTVTGPSLTWADAFATTVFAMGEPGLKWIEQFDGYGAVPVRADR